MKKTLKFFSFIAAVLVLLSALTACSKDKNNKENNTGDMTYEEIYKATAEQFSDNKNPVAIIVMENGDAIAFEMYSDKAPNTVLNFISLANKGFYDGVIFHRVIGNFMIQTGDPLGTGMGGPGYMIEGEFSNNDCDNDISHEAGVVSMARQGNPYYPALAYNTAGSQFFICTDSNNVKHLDGDYAAFGKVIYGMDTVYAIAAVETDSKDRPLSEQKMAYVRVDTHGVQYDEPETIAE
ncbi:MAG: peptidylprolyl isomerase [Oscillospiraceae bacterium]|nr:peptidylprolyl isomerase [Oscillospiraceae bacterium]